MGCCRSSFDQDDRSHSAVDCQTSCESEQFRPSRGASPKPKQVQSLSSESPSEGGLVGAARLELATSCSQSKRLRPSSLA